MKNLINTVLTWLHIRKQPKRSSGNLTPSERSAEFARVKKLPK